MERLQVSSPEAYQEFLDKRLPRKVMGTAEELMPIIKLLCGEGADIFAGSIIRCDAGEGIGLDF